MPQRWFGLPVALQSNKTTLWLPLTFVEEVQMYKVKKHPEVALAEVIERTGGKAMCHQSPVGSGPTQGGFGVVFRGFLSAETYSGGESAAEDPNRHVTSHTTLPL